MSSKQVLSEADYARAAAKLGVDIAAIKAVTEVEAPRGGFQPDGRPTILFERHIFDRRTGGKYRTQAPDLSNPRPGGYGPGSTQHARLERAAKLNRKAALESASWGKFQIMGFNHALAGYPDLQAFINAMYKGEGEQLDAFVGFLKGNPPIRGALAKHDWVTFARLYNGPSFRVNSYDTKLAAAYAKHSKA